MSLDVYLENDSPVHIRRMRTGVYVRDNGRTYELSPEEAPEQAQMVDEVTTTLYTDNITHNLNKMAEEAGLYKFLWTPESVGITTAAGLVTPLSVGLARLKADPDHFKTFNPESGWGDYETLVEFVNNYLTACYAYPEAKVCVSR